jgi:hypothetical protein
LTTRPGAIARPCRPGQALPGADAHSTAAKRFFAEIKQRPRFVRHPVGMIRRRRA